MALDDLAPRLALLATPAPVQLEQHVAVEVRVDLVQVDLDLAHAPERRLGHRGVRAAAERTESSVVGGGVHPTGLVAELSASSRICATNA